MPILDILNGDDKLRWDAPGILEAVIFFPHDLNLREQYVARWRAEHKSLLPSGRRNAKTTYNLAKEFGGRKLEANRAILRKGRVRVERIGTALLLQAVLSKLDASNATESKVAYALGRLDNQKGIKTSRSTIRRDWAMYRGVVHWCAAVAYQRWLFGAPLLCHPNIGPAEYSIYMAIWDFLRLGHEFYSFARDNGCFGTTLSFQPERDLWTLPLGLGAVAPKRADNWPNCDRIMASALPDPAVLAPLQDYDATLYRA